MRIEFLLKCLRFGTTAPRRGSASSFDRRTTPWGGSVACDRAGGFRCTTEAWWRGWGPQSRLSGQERGGPVEYVGFHGL